MLWTAFMLGFAGSLHCAGMCGPLALAVPIVGKGNRALFLSRLTYNLGRVVLYGLMGGVAGFAGQAFAFAGIQRWVSLTTGVLILGGVLVSSRWLNAFPASQFLGPLKRTLGLVLQRRTYLSVGLLGGLNGLLPCGLVYVAATAALASHHWLDGVGYMLLFGLGTVPMMLGIGLTGARLPLALRFRLQRLVPLSLVVVGSLLLMRGLALGIPYLSPGDPGNGVSCPMCAQHRPAGEVPRSVAP